MSDFAAQINARARALWAAAELSPSADDQAALCRLLTASDFAAHWLAQRPALVPVLDAGMTPETLGERLALALSGVADEAEFMQRLRQWRNDEQVRLIRLEVENQPALPERLALLSSLADAAIAAAVRFAEAELARRFGSPEADPCTRKPQSLAVLGMGKLGADELNLSSDIDLIFTFAAEGQTTDPERSISHSEFFTRVGRKVIRYLDQRTADGIVYRVDMRLRPNGQSGPLALSYGAMMTYYRDQGRDWERYAMIKARPVTAQDSAEAGLMPGLREFVFRRYVDYQVLTSLRDMKRRIAGENRRLQRRGNIKLGRGGIREIEFVVQAVQLIQGGQLPALTQPNLFQVMPVLAAEGLLPADVCAELLADYSELRHLEHLLQAQQDRQTQTLPTDPIWQQRLLATLAEPDDWTLFQGQLDRLHERVSAHFDAFIAEPSTADTPQGQDRPDWQDLRALDWAEWFAADAETIRACFFAFHDEVSGLRLPAAAQQRLARLLPRLLIELQRLQNPVLAAQRVLPVLLAVVRRSAYLVMLLENPGAIRELVKLSALSPWVARQLKEKPYLLDELTDTDQLYRLPDRKTLRDDLHQRLLRLSDDDLEQQMEQLRHFRHSRVLRAAACELTGNLPVMQISDYLTYTAEEVLQQVFWLAWSQMTEKYGVPTRSDGSLCDTDFVILAYGKLGGQELSYESDLDLVFIHDGNSGGTTRGGRKVDNTVFFVRLGQRIVHFLTTQTPSGVLYEADMRLRPSGNSGLLVSSFAAFATYQRQNAWTWERQALVRGRTVAGDPQLRARVEELRSELLASPRPGARLAADVVAMREKMRATLATPPAYRHEQFRIKQDPGGMVDIEFLVQYLVLARAGQYPELTRWSDNIRLLKALTRNHLITVTQGEALSAAYLHWREVMHGQVLQDQDSILQAPAELADQAETRTLVQSAWAQHLANAVK